MITITTEQKLLGSMAALPWGVSLLSGEGTVSPTSKRRFEAYQGITYFTSKKINLRKRLEAWTESQS